MGLLSKAQGVLGIVKNKAATALGGIYRGSGTVGKLARRVAGFGIVKGAAKVALGTAKFGGRVLFGTKIRAALTAGTVAIAVGKKLLGRKAQQQTAAGAAAGQGSGILSKILKGAAVVAGVGAAGFAAEKIAEKLGIRGGAGFIGRRLNGRGRRRAGRGRRRHRVVTRGRRHRIVHISHKHRRKKSKSRGQIVSFTTKSGQRVRFRARR